jgi:hypothetical protein
VNVVPWVEIYYFMRSSQQSEILRHSRAIRRFSTPGRADDDLTKHSFTTRPVSSIVSLSKRVGRHALRMERRSASSFSSFVFVLSSFSYFDA